MVNEEDIIFQVKINRKLKAFELVKTELDNFEQSDFIMFLEGYVAAMKKHRMDEMISDYGLDYEEEEEDTVEE